MSDEAVPAEERLTGEALCAEAFQGQNQRPAADFTPATAVDSKPEVVSLLGVGTTPDGFCLDTGTEFHGSPWEIATITVTASLLGDGMSESRHSRTTAWDNERLPFFVPADGCTQVSGTIELIHPETGKTRTWTAAEVFHPRRRGACDEVSGDGEPSPS